jgi:hypothetical protein
MEAPRIEDGSEDAVQSLINGIQDPQLKEAIKLIWSKRGEVEEQPNEAHWPIEGTSGGQNCCLMIGVVQW